MSIITDRIYQDANGAGACAEGPDAAAKSYLVEALGTTLDSIDVGVIIVGREARILHASQVGAQCTEASTLRDDRRSLIEHALGRLVRFAKTGVSRRTDLLTLITRLVPPIRRPH